jgi:hypothetical protein
MDNDERCCGTGTCIIDPQGYCWCGQRWDGEKMSRASFADTTAPACAAPQPELQPQPESTQTRS